MSALELTAKFKIKKGKLDEFKSVARKCMKSTKEKDTGNLQYDWYFSEDKNICEVRERYTDSNAVLEHVGNLGELFGQLLALSSFSVDVYGKPSAKLMKAVAGLKTRVLTPFISKK